MISLGERFGQLIAAALALLVALAMIAACASDDAVEPVAQAAPPTATATSAPTPTPAPTPTSAPPTTAPPPATTTPPPATVAPESTPYPNAILGLVGGPPSQSDQDAERDGVLSEVAFLSFVDRVDVLDEVSINGDRWVLSRFPRSTWPALPGLGPWEHSVDSGSSELLHLDGDTIIKAVPMVSSPATWITAVDTTIYTGRVGDGAYPDSTLVRLNTESDELNRLRLPWSYGPDRVAFSSGHWDMANPSSVEVLLPLIAPIAAGDPNAQAVAALDQAMQQTTKFDPWELPRLSLTRSGCDIGAAEHYFDFGTHCIVEQGSRVTGDTSVLISGESVPGSLVGAGWMSPNGPTYAAIIAPAAADGSEEESPLLFVDIVDPSIVVDTGVPGRGIISEIGQVSFFDGGFITTTSVDLSVRVDGFNSRFEPLPIFASPTNADLGYPPDPFISHAAMAPDGQSLATAQRAWPFSGDGLPGTALTIVVADSNDGEELRRIELDVASTQLVRWLDFDGRWAVVSFRGIAEDAGGDRPAVVIDTTNGEVYRQGFGWLAMRSLERIAAPDEPTVRIMTPGPYTHGQTITVRLAPGPLVIQEGERLAARLGAVMVCEGAFEFAPCVQLPVENEANYGEVPIESDFTLSQIVGNVTTGDIAQDTAVDCAEGGCVLRTGSTTFPIEFTTTSNSPPPQQVEIDIDDLSATVAVNSAVFDGPAVILICLAQGSEAQQAHRAGAAAQRVSFCTDLTRIDVSNGSAQATIALREDLAAACAVGECSVQLFFE